MGDYREVAEGRGSEGGREMIDIGEGLMYFCVGYIVVIIAGKLGII